MTGPVERIESPLPTAGSGMSRGSVMVQRSCSSDGQSCGPNSGAEAGCLPESLGETSDTAVVVCSFNADEEVYRAPAPFALQLCRQLLLLVENPGGFWQIVETEF